MRFIKINIIEKKNIYYDVVSASRKSADTSTPFNFDTASGCMQDAVFFSLLRQYFAYS